MLPINVLIGETAFRYYNYLLESFLSFKEASSYTTRVHRNDMGETVFVVSVPQSSTATIAFSSEEDENQQILQEATLDGATAALCSLISKPTR